MTKHSFAGLLFLAIIAETAGAKCVVRDGTFGPFKAVILENDLVRVSVLPENTGCIAEYYLKGPGCNQFLPFEVKARIPVGDTAITQNNFGGYRDFMVEEGILCGDRNYQAAVEKNTAAEAAVRVWHDSANRRLERTVSIVDGQPFVRVEVKITARKDNLPVTYWTHTYVRPGGLPYRPEETFAFTPLYGNQEILPDNTVKVTALRAGASESGALAAECMGTVGGAKGSGKPVQPWRAVVNVPARIILADRFPLEQMGQGPVIYTQWEPVNAGMELRFGTFTAKKGNCVTHRITYHSVLGLDRLDYLTDALALDLGRESQWIVERDRAAAWTWRFSPTGNYPAGYTLKVNLRNEKKELSLATLVRLPALVFGRVVEQKIGMDTRKVPPGRYTLDMALTNDQGKAQEQFAILSKAVLVK